MIFIPGIVTPKKREILPTRPRPNFPQRTPRSYTPRRPLSTLLNLAFKSSHLTRTSSSPYHLTTGCGCNCTSFSASFQSVTLVFTGLSIVPGCAASGSGCIPLTLPPLTYCLDINTLNDCFNEINGNTPGTNYIDQYHDAPCYSFLQHWTTYQVSINMFSGSTGISTQLFIGGGSCNSICFYSQQFPQTWCGTGSLVLNNMVSGSTYHGFNVAATGGQVTITANAGTC